MAAEGVYSLQWSDRMARAEARGRDLMTLNDLNGLDRDAFVAALGGLFEGPPWLVEEAWGHRPFASKAQLHQTLCDVMYAARLARQVELLRAHPDLAGRAALAGTLSPASTNEQASAGLDQLTPGEMAEFTRLNTAYRARFGFPFVMCARQSTKREILAAFARRLDSSYDTEVRTALDEVSKICALRLDDVLAGSDPA